MAEAVASFNRGPPAVEPPPPEPDHSDGSTTGETSADAGPPPAEVVIGGPEPGASSRLSRIVERLRRPATWRGWMAAAVRLGKAAIKRLPIGTPKQVTSLSIEHGSIKVLVTDGVEIIDHHIESANPQLFREGLVSDTLRMAGLLQRALQQSNGEHRRAITAVPGYQTTLRRLELPRAKGMDPKVMIPNEARRNMGISLENSQLKWHELAGTVDTAHWLVLSATHRSVGSLTATAEGAGLKVSTVELRPFALARAISQPDAICAWTAPDGCDAIVIRDWTPVTHQSAYWTAASTLDSSDLANRIVEVVESAIAAHDMQNPDISVPSDLPLFVTGSPIGRDPAIAQRVASALQRPLGEFDIPLELPADFPVHDMIVNLGLALWAA